MTTQSLDRAKKEFLITLAALREVVLAVAERVNRRVQVMRLHWQTTEIATRMEGLYQEVGERLTNLAARDKEALSPGWGPDQVEAILQDVTPWLRQHRKDLSQVTASMRELEVEALTEELLKVHQDLTNRSGTIQRLVVVRGANVIGRPVPHLGLPPAVRVAGVFRGPTALTVNGHTGLKAGDVVVLVGPRAEVARVVAWFTEGQSASA